MERRHTQNNRQYKAWGDDSVYTNPERPTHDKEGFCKDIPQLRVVLLALLPLQPNWNGTPSMSAEAPGHKTRETVISHSCCNHRPQQRLHHVEEGGKKGINLHTQTELKGKEKKILFGWTFYASRYITITQTNRDNLFSPSPLIIW